MVESQGRTWRRCFLNKPPSIGDGLRSKSPFETVTKNSEEVLLLFISLYYTIVKYDQKYTAISWLFTHYFLLWDWGAGKQLEAFQPIFNTQLPTFSHLFQEMICKYFCIPNGKFNQMNNCPKMMLKCVVFCITMGNRFWEFYTMYFIYLSCKTNIKLLLAFVRNKLLGVP